MNNLLNRLIKLEEQLNSQGKMIVIVDETEGENIDDKLTEKEKELGYKINRDKLILVTIRDFTDSSIKEKL